MDTHTPARLYKYQRFSSRTLLALKKRTVWFGKPSELNDPFDCAVPYSIAPVTLEGCARLLAEKDTEDWGRLRTEPGCLTADGRPTEQLRMSIERAGRKAVDDMARRSYEERGVTCFSENPDNMLLWSHYGGGHRGFCLEFDTSSPELGRYHRVCYTDVPPAIDVVESMLGNTAHALAVLLTKGACWSYEREWRAIHAKAGTEYCYGIEALTGVYLGAALGDAEKDLIAHILHGSPAKLYQMTRVPNSFALQPVSLNYSPYQYAPTAAV